MNNFVKLIIITALFFNFLSIAHQSLSNLEIKEIINKNFNEAADKSIKEIKKAIKKTNQNVDIKKLTNSVKLSDNIQWIKTGSGTVGGSYFVLAELIGGIISHPQGSLPCNLGGTCGILGLQSLNITSHGSQTNIESLKKKLITTGFIQSDLAYLAYKGLGPFAKKGKAEELRAIASLYPEAVHILTRKEANINTISDFAGRNISIGHKDSGTSLIAKTILDAFDLSETDVNINFLSHQDSIKKLESKEIDAMFFVVGAPAPAIQQLFTESNDFKLISIKKGLNKNKLLKKGYYFKPYRIPTNTYNNEEAIDTISVFSLWITHKQVSESLVYQLTKSLWSDASKQLLNSSFIGQQINIKNSLDGIGIPLHKGAKKYYNEIGKKF